MIRLSNLADYAVVIMSHIAQDESPSCCAGDVAAATGVSAATTSKIMGMLARGDLLESRRGVGGGFHLARRAGEITVADIIEAVDGPIAMTNCVEEAHKGCSLEPICHVRPHWQAINGAIKTALSDVTLADIATPSSLPLHGKADNMTALEQS